MSHLSGLATYPAYAQQCLAPPLVPSSVLSVPTAPLCAGPVSTCVASTLPTIVVTSTPTVTAGTDTRPTYVSLGVPLTSASPIVDTKAVPLASVATSVSVPPPSTQVPVVGSLGQTSGMVGPIAVSPAPTVVVMQPESVRPYTCTTSYKAYKEYFERICVCNEWKTPTECARHLLVAMDGAASEAVRELKAEKDADLAVIWEALSRRFGFVDEPERAMRRFDVRKQLEGETLAVFEQSLRMLHREAWPKTDIKSPEADSLLRRKFVDSILDIELQKYLRLHAASYDFATTVSKARQFVDANELSRTAKKPALRATSPSVNYQSIVDGVLEALERDRGRMVEVNAIQASNSSATTGNRNKEDTATPGIAGAKQLVSREFLQPRFINWPHCLVLGPGG